MSLCGRPGAHICAARPAADPWHHRECCVSAWESYYKDTVCKANTLSCARPLPLNGGDFGGRLFGDVTEVRTSR